MNGIEILIERIANAPDVIEDRSESRFFQIQSDMEKGNYNEAVQLVRDLFNEGYFDIRLIAYYLYVHVLNSGREGLIQAYKMLRLMLKDHRAKLFPFSQSTKQSAGALKWFFTTLARSFKRAAAKIKNGQQSDLWDLLIADISQESFDALHEEMQSTLGFFREYFQETENFEEVFGYLCSWLEELRVFIPEEAVENVEEVVENVEEVVDKEDSKESVKQVDKKPVIEPQKKKSDQAAALVEERDSYPWRELKAKLRLFGRLMEDKTPDAELKRTIAIKDICYLIENFNPAIYFPREFIQFYTLLAKSKEPLTVESDSPNAFTWNTLSSLYQIDLESFEKWSRG